MGSPEEGKMEEPRLRFAGCVTGDGDIEKEGEEDKCAGWERSFPIQGEGRDWGAGRGCSEGPTYMPGRGLGMGSFFQGHQPDLLCLVFFRTPLTSFLCRYLHL